MYPASFFHLFPPFPRDNKVFVAMSFASAFTHRWEKVIMPAIARVQIDGQPLEPIRIDQCRISDSILVEILDGIRRSRLILADITAIGEISGKPVRNGNVLYELGIAQYPLTRACLRWESFVRNRYMSPRMTWISGWAISTAILSRSSGKLLLTM